MLFVYINDTLRTSDLEANSLSISNNIQQKSDSCNFSIISGSKPSENQDLKIYKGDLITDVTGAVITLNGYFQLNKNQFYEGQKLWIGIGNADMEEVEVSSYNETLLQITLTKSPAGTHVLGDKVGEIIFGGVISSVSDRNEGALSRLEYDIEGVDYTKIFDKKLINDSWEDVDGRYIINSFLNSTVNYCKTIDDFDYNDNSAIQAEWIESGDGTNPTIDSADFLEGNASGVLSWTYSGGSATFSATPTSSNISDYTGANSGTPTKGFLMLWLKLSDYTKITSLKIRIGSSASDYAEVDINLPTDNNWVYKKTKLSEATIAGTPDWTALDYSQIIIAETATSSLKVNGLRINSNESFSMEKVDSTPDFDDYRAPNKSPTSLMQQLANAFSYVWYIDYNRDIYFKSNEIFNAPFSLTTTSNNFDDLSIEVDQRDLGNRVQVLGGKGTSTSDYSEVFKGDNVRREWKLRTFFAGLSILIDDNTATDTMEAGTNTTTINATGHGLTIGDHIVCRDRGSVVREVLTTPSLDQFTVEAVPSQTSGDTFSKFTIVKTVAIDGATDETLYDYMSNYPSQSVRASTSTTATLTSTDFIRFTYYEKFDLAVEYSDGASVSKLKALGVGDGIVDLDPITDENIIDTAVAYSIGEAKVRQYSNPIISGKFQTDWHGLKAGQLINIIDTYRSINENYLIQKVSIKSTGDEYGDYFIYNVSFGSTLFGWIEFMQKLLGFKEKIGINADAIIQKIASSLEVFETSDVNQVATDGGFLNSKNTETFETSDVDQVVIMTGGTWQYESSVGQTLPTRFNLADYD